MPPPAPGGAPLSGSVADRLDTIAAVDSPEQIRFEYRVAGPARRALAYLVDLLIKAAVLIGLGFLLMLGGFDYDQLTGWTTGLYALVAFSLEWGYNVLFESLTGGRTPGKRAMRLRVVKEGGHPINFMDALLRNLLRAADFLPNAYAVGVAVMGFDPHFRRLGDLVAGTMVVVEERSSLGRSVQLNPPPSPQELALIPASARLRPDEREALDVFVRRLDRLSTARADELAELILPRFRDRLPPQAAEHPGRALSVLYLRSTQRRGAS